MEERLLREAQKSNPWWFGERAKDVPEYRRKISKYISKYMRSKQILSLIGLRRVGKTVLMKQLITDVLSGGTNPKNVLFFSFDESWGTQQILEDLFYYFLESISGVGKKFIFLDEIQKVEKWEYVLKRFYDRHGQDIKFVISGSASIHISKSVESLAGRIFDIHIIPLTFQEFLEMNGVDAGPQKRFSHEHEDLNGIYRQNLHQREKISNLFGEYLFKGGFPEMAREEDEELVRKYIMNSVIERILLKDLPEEFEIKKPESLRAILEYIAKETSGILVINKLASILGLDKETVSNYVEHLKMAFLIFVAHNYSESIAKRIRSSKKMHIVLPSIALALESYDKAVLLHPEIMGKYVESVISVFLSYKYERRTFFWRTPQKEEVDIVIKGTSGLIPIEVKYKSRITDDEIKSMIKFMEKYGVKSGFVITKDLFDKRKIRGKAVMLVPAWAFLLSLTQG